MPSFLEKRKMGRRRGGHKRTKGVDWATWHTIFNRESAGEDEGDLTQTPCQRYIKDLWQSTHKRSIIANACPFTPPPPLLHPCGFAGTTTKQNMNLYTWCVCKCKHIHTHIYIYVYIIHAHTRVYMRVCVCKCMHAHVCVRVCV